MPKYVFIKIQWYFFYFKVFQPFFKKTLKKVIFQPFFIFNILKPNIFKIVKNADFSFILYKG